MVRMMMHSGIHCMLCVSYRLSDLQDEIVLESFTRAFGSDRVTNVFQGFVF